MAPGISIGARRAGDAPWQEQTGQGHAKSTNDVQGVFFDDLNGSVALCGEDIDALAAKLTEAFDEYFKALD